MLDIFIIIIGAVLLVSLLSLVGVFFLSISDKILNKILLELVALFSGALLGGAFLHLIPKAFETLRDAAFVWVLIGLLFFYIMERYLHWRHCHKGKCDIHVFAYNNLIGNEIHNLIDGMIIAASFLVSIPVGIITTLAIILHKILQEIWDFKVLVYARIEKKKALLYNLLSALTSIIGALIVFFLPFGKENIAILLPFAAGGFIYITGSDLIPELKKK